MDSRGIWPVDQLKKQQENLLVLCHKIMLQDAYVRHTAPIRLNGTLRKTSSPNRRERRNFPTKTIQEF